MRKTQILDELAITQKVRRMAYEIVEADFEDGQMIMIGVCDGGYLLARLLCEEIRKISPLTITLRELNIDKMNPALAPVRVDVQKEDIDGKTVLLVDDVANTGRTMYYALKPIMEFAPARVQVAVLVDRQHKRFPIASDFVGLSLSTSLQEHISVDIEKMTAFLH